MGLSGAIFCGRRLTWYGTNPGVGIWVRLDQEFDRRRAVRGDHDLQNKHRRSDGSTSILTDPLLRLQQGSFGNGQEPWHHPSTQLNSPMHDGGTVQMALSGRHFS